MHKIVPKERYLAASHACTTKPLSNLINKCLKLITSQHEKYCNKVYKNTGVNRMWVINNSNKVLNKIQDYNDEASITNVDSYDFSTLYTKIPHEDLKEKLYWVINKAFYNRTKKAIFVTDYSTTWTKEKCS